MFKGIMDKLSLREFGNAEIYWSVCQLAGLSAYPEFG